MAFRKFLDRRKIIKSVDNTTSLSPITKIPIGTPKSEEKENPPTSAETLVQDVLSLARQVSTSADNLAQDIVKANQGDVDFSRYAELAALTRFDSSRLLTDSNARPEKVDRVELARLERSVYRRLVDPKAPFLVDIYRVGNEADLNLYTAGRVWSRASESQGLSASLNGRLPRLALHNDLQNLQTLQSYLSQVANLVPVFMESVDVSALGRTLVSLVSENGNSRHGPSLIHLLDRSILSSNEAWEKAQAILADVLDDVVGLASSRTILQTNYAVYQGASKEIDQLSNALGGLLDTSASLVFMVEAASNELLEAQKGIEVDLLEKQRIASVSDEARYLLIANVLRASGLKNQGLALASLTNAITHAVQANPDSQEEPLLEVIDPRGIRFDGTIVAYDFPTQVIL